MLEKMTREFEDHTGTLICYSSGSGALDFCWNRQQKGRTVASGVSTTMEDVKEFMSTTVDGLKFSARHWEPMVINSNPILVQRVERIGLDALRILDSGEHSIAGDYRYVIDEWYDGNFYDYQFHVFANMKKEEYSVGNWSIRGVLRFYLQNEKAILAMRN